MNNNTFGIFIIGLLCFVGVVTIGIIFGIPAAQKEACDYDWKDTGYEYRWSEEGGCQIKIPGGWIHDYIFIRMKSDMK